MATELCTNGGFEVDASGWTKVGDAAAGLGRVTTQHYDGAAALRIYDGGTAREEAGTCIGTYSFNIPEGTTALDISLWGKTATAEAHSVTVAYNGGAPETITDTFNDSGWAQATYHKDITTQTTGVLSISVTSTAATTAYIYVDLVSISASAADPLSAGAITENSVTATTANLTATAATGGTEPYTYQWYRSTTSDFEPGAGNILTGQTALTLADNKLSASTTYYYKVIATDGADATVTYTQEPVTTTYSILRTPFTSIIRGGRRRR